MLDGSPDPTAEARRATRLFLWLALFLAVLGAMPLARRIKFDRINTRLEVIADLQGFREVARATSISDDRLLADLAAAGVSAVAIRPCSTDQLAADGILEIQASAQPGRTRLRLAYPDCFSVASTTAALFPGTRVELDSVDVPVAGELFRKTPIFLDREMVRKARSAGLEVVYRLPNVQWAGPEFLRYFIFMVPERATVVFDEDSALGWPGSIGLVAKAFHVRNLRVGQVEFSGQDGVAELLSAQPVKSAFLHSIPPREMAKLPYSRLLPRWRRAAEERNVRHFYLHPLAPGQNPWDRKDLYEATFAYVRELFGSLAAAGFVKGEPVAANAYLSVALEGLHGDIYRAAAALGAACLVLAFLAMLEPFPVGWLRVVAVPIAAVCLASPRVAALAAAVGAAALSAAVFERRTRWPLGLLATARELALVLGLNYVGGALLYEILSDPAYVMHRAAFSGVKLVYLAPIALACLELLRRERVRLLSVRLVALDLALVAAVAGGGALYLMRSGNFSAVPATQAEQGLRDRMEETLPARPRTKEFLIGYPALALLAFLAHGGSGCSPSWRARLLLLIAGTVAPVSIANSFCHLHSPVLLTAKRGLVGLVFGWAALAILWPLRRAVAIAAGGPYVSFSGYFGYGNLGDEWMLANELRAAREAAQGRASLLVFLRRPDHPGVAVADRWSPADILAGMAASRVHVSGGGGLFQDSTGPFTFPYYLTFPALARLLGTCDTVFAGHSFAGLSRPWYRSLLAWYTIRAELTLARDPTSAAALKRWAGDSGQVPHALEWPELGVDPVFWYEPTSERRHESSRILGVNLRPTSAFPKEVLARVADGLRSAAASRGLTVRFLALFPEQDLPFLEGIATPAEIREVDPGNAVRVFSELHAVVAMRYHAMLLAALTGTPLLALSYDPKTDALLAECRHDRRLDPGPVTESAANSERALVALLDDPVAPTERLAVWARSQLKEGERSRQRFIEVLRDRLQDR
ncbi:MAG: polysaccharide pyruvyl transferase family protein [Candidatus Wallbacteria bacterium]|nr:polysaccharide pyruvyl transferase family protein [Candidatus Wallbacteria bacterium]